MKYCFKPTSLLYKQDLMNICLRQLETCKNLCEFFQARNLYMALQDSDYLLLMLFSQNSDSMDSKSLNSIIIIGLTHASKSLHWSVGKMNDDWNCFLIIKSTLRAFLLNFDIPLAKMPKTLIIITGYLNSWTISECVTSNTKWSFFFFYLPATFVNLCFVSVKF